MTGYTHSFDPNKFNFDKNEFDPEKDTARPVFYMQDDLDPHTNTIVKTEMIKIQSPGEALNVYGGKVREIDRRRFSVQYEAFRRGETITDGTPLSAWPEVAANIEFLSQLRAFGFQTVEDVSKMADSAQRLFHGSLTWKKKAQIFVEQQNKLKAGEADKAAQDAKDAQISALMERISALESAPVKNKGGRPRKQAEQTAAA